MEKKKKEEKKKIHKFLVVILFLLFEQRAPYFSFCIYSTNKVAGKEVGFMLS